MSLTVPTASDSYVDTPAGGVLKRSRGITIILRSSYDLWLFFQLRTYTIYLKHPAETRIPKKSRKAISTMNTKDQDAAATSPCSRDAVHDVIGHGDEPIDQPQLSA